MPPQAGAVEAVGSTKRITGAAVYVHILVLMRGPKKAFDSLVRSRPSAKCKPCAHVLTMRAARQASVFGSGFVLFMVIGSFTCGLLGEIRWPSPTYVRDEMRNEAPQPSFELFSAACPPARQVNGTICS